MSVMILILCLIASTAVEVDAYGEADREDPGDDTKILPVFKQRFKYFKVSSFISVFRWSNSIFSCPVRF